MESMIAGGGRLRLGVALSFLLEAAGAAAAGLDLVELDVASGVFAERLPFDVPFLVVGEAPPGTSRVEAVYELRRDALAAFVAAGSGAPIRTGVDPEGRFRVPLPALPPNRQVRFRFTFDRRLGAAGSLRADFEDALRRALPSEGSDLGPEQDAALRAALVARYELALNAGRTAGGAGGDTIRQGAGALLDADASADALRRDVKEMGKEVFAAGLARQDALARWRDVARSLEGQLAGLAGSEELTALLAALESRPETDPRNGANPLALSSAARRLVGLAAASRAAVARGQPAGAAGVDLASASDPADAEAVAERYRGEAAALQELREWLGGTVLGTEAGRRVTDELVARGEIDVRALDALRSLCGLQQGVLHRAERWAEALAATAQEVARSLRAREQAIERMASALEARALGVTLRQTLVSEPATTEAGLYVGLDLGVLYPPELDRAALYVGANLYFRPVNKRASLRTHGGLGQRFSLTFGISLTDLKLETGDPRFEPLLGDRSNLLLGAGLRLSRSLRVSAGALLFLENDKNPLVEDRSLAATFYTALSFDVDVVRAFRSMGK